MPTAVVRLDATALPHSLQLDARYQRALLVVSWRGRPTGHVEVPLIAGVLSGQRLREAVEKVAGYEIAMLQLDEWLAWDMQADVVPPRASIAICTRDRPADLERCLASMVALPDDAQEILVIDSASRDAAAVRRLVQRHTGVRYIREDRPGLDIARNRALREASGEIIIFCDDDAEVDQRWLRALSRNFGNPRTLCVTGLILPQELETPAQEVFERTNGFARGYTRRVHDGVTDDAFFVSRIGAGASMALRRNVLDLIGPFDEALDAGTPTRSGGDHDYFTRILAAGYVCVYEPAALSWHRHRREWHELRAAVRGYGSGVWAYLTRQLLQGELRAAYVAAAWLVWQTAGLLANIVGRRTLLPRDLAIAEMLGCFEGPAAYVRSRRAQRALRIAP